MENIAINMAGDLPARAAIEDMLGRVTTNKSA